jgi:hypothetical protein
LAPLLEEIDVDEGNSAKNMVIIVANHASSTGRRYRPAMSSAV